MTGWRRKIKSTVCPLIHTPLEFTLTYDIVSCQRKKKRSRSPAVWFEKPIVEGGAVMPLPKGMITKIRPFSSLGYFPMKCSHAHTLTHFFCGGTQAANSGKYSASLNASTFARTANESYSYLPVTTSKCTGGLPG